MNNSTDFNTIKQSGYTNVLKYRGENQKSGISYDYMDKLNEFVGQGIFIDAKKDGFTNSEKRALEAELFKIHKEHNYATNFNSMLAGTTTEYSYNDFIRLAQAAGYVLKEEPKKIQTKEIEQTEEVQTHKEAAPVQTETVQKKPEKEEATAQEKLLAALNADSELAGKEAKERLQILKNRDAELTSEKRQLEKTTTTYQTKGLFGLFKKTKTRDLTPEELAENQAKIHEIDNKLEENMRHLVYVRDVEASKYWVGRTAPQELKDKEGNLKASYPQIDKVILKDKDGKEFRALRVETYNPRTIDYSYKYYSVDVQKVGNASLGQEFYYSVVPDMNNELVGYDDPYRE